MKTQSSNSKRSMRRKPSRGALLFDAVVSGALTVLLIPAIAFLLTLLVVIAQQ